MSEDIWPRGELHSTDRKWRPNNHWNRLLDYTDWLFVDVARHDPSWRSDERWKLLQEMLGPPK